MKNEFIALKRKIFTQVLLIGIGCMAVSFFVKEIIIDGIFQIQIAEGVVSILQVVFRLSYRDAVYAYQTVFQNNKSLILALLFFVLILVVFYRAMNRFTKYFSEIGEGVDKLTQEGDKEIKLSPELETMESKLNHARETVALQKQHALESEQRKNDLVVYLAHDIKTPLTSIIGYLSLMDEAPDMPVKQRAKYTKITLDKAYRLEQLINEFFEITRFNLQTIVIEREEIHLGLMLEQMADEFYPMLEPDGKSAVVDVPANLVLYGDADKLARVFNNILKNAAAYSFANTKIELFARKELDRVVITIKNRGPVIPEHRLKTIFEKFYRLDSARTTRTGGAGLGLAIAKEIVEAHGGTIGVRSTEAFTMFTVMLPVT